MASKISLETMQSTALFTAEHLKSFEEKGFCVLKRVIPAEHLQLLRDEDDRLVAEEDARADIEGLLDWLPAQRKAN